MDRKFRQKANKETADLNNATDHMAWGQLGVVLMTSVAGSQSSRMAWTYVAVRGFRNSKRASLDVQGLFKSLLIFANIPYGQPRYKDWCHRVHFLTEGSVISHCKGKHGKGGTICGHFYNLPHPSSHFIPYPSFITYSTPNKWLPCFSSEMADMLSPQDLCTCWSLLPEIFFHQLST